MLPGLMKVFIERLPLDCAEIYICSVLYHAWKIKKIIKKKRSSQTSLNINSIENLFHEVGYIA